MKIKIKEPYFSIKKLFRSRNIFEPSLSTIKILYYWFKLNVLFFYRLYFKKCDSYHFFNEDHYCLRCKKYVRYIDKERRLRQLIKEKKEKKT